MALRRRLQSSLGAPPLDGESRGARANDNDEADARERSLESLEARLDREASSSDLLDVPAAVVCLVCGELDCTGCEDRDLSRSGIVAIVAWERPAMPALTRLWATARSTTRDAESFFELLPDGPVMPALRFAAICELLAAFSMVLLVLPVAAVVAPGWLSHVALDPNARAFALRVIFLGVPAFAAFLVFLHTVHALAIDVGASSSGARHARSRALRFGLYACGWDLVIGPLGAIIVAFKEGLAAGLAVLDLVSVPGRATRAFLRGCYRLEGERAKKPLATAATGVVVATLLGVVAVIAALFAL
ncbi:MAG: hypothetical protein JWP87_4680, partial [Labilithrix sp.]|nr:hypothetical protein [Labilithrix sp.]